MMGTTGTRLRDIMRFVRQAALSALFLIAPIGTCGRADAAVLDEDFSSGGAGLPPGWTAVNRSSPAGPHGWFKGGMYTSLKSRDGDDTFAGANWDAAGPGGQATASAWLISSPVVLENGQTLSFAACAFDTGFADRLQVRMNVANSGASVGSDAHSYGDFTRLLIDVNPAYATRPDAGAFPVEWTTYTLRIDGLAGPVNGRLAFRYFVEDAGEGGTRGGEVGVDDVRLVALPEPSAIAGPVVIAYALVRRPRRPRSKGTR